MIRIQEAGCFLRDDPAKRLLALDQRQLAEILAVQHQQIEGVQVAIPSVPQQFVELGLAATVQADDLAVNDSFPALQGCVNILCQGGETLKALPLRETKRMPAWPENARHRQPSYFTSNR
jgi:hypothetical protein